MFWRGERSFDPTGNQTLNCPAHSLVTAGYTIPKYTIYDLILVWVSSLCFHYNVVLYVVKIFCCMSLTNNYQNGYSCVHCVSKLTVFTLYLWELWKLFIISRLYVVPLRQCICSVMFITWVHVRISHIQHNLNLNDCSLRIFVI